LLARDYKDPKRVMIKEATKQGYDIAEPGDAVNFENLGSETRRGRVGHGIANSLIAGCNQGVVEAVPLVDLEAEQAFVRSQMDEIMQGRRPDKDMGITYQENGNIRPYASKKGDENGNCGMSELYVDHESNPSHTVTSTQMPKVYGDSTHYRIRKLTPRECFRLQGFPDWAFEAAEKVNSNSQLYKQAGNSVTVNVIVAIASHF